jgi:dynein heavy chain
LGGFDETKHWNAELEEVAKRFLKEPSQTKLFVWSEG